MHIYCYISFLYNYYNMFQAFEENLYRIYIIEKIDAEMSETNVDVD